MGWAGRKNGSLLLTLTEAGFQAFLTLDKSLPFQQNLTNLPIAMVILRVRSNRFPDIAPLVPSVLNALATASPGDVIRLGPPEQPASTPAA